VGRCTPNLPVPLGSIFGLSKSILSRSGAAQDSDDFCRAREFDDQGRCWLAEAEKCRNLSNNESGLGTKELIVDRQD